MLKCEFVQKSNFDFMQNSNECFMQNSNECYLISIAWLLPRQHSLGDDPGNGPGNLRCMHPEATKSLTLRSSEQAASHAKSPQGLPMAPTHFVLVLLQGGGQRGIRSVRARGQRASTKGRGSLAQLPPTKLIANSGGDVSPILPASACAQALAHGVLTCVNLFSIA